MPAKIVLKKERSGKFRFQLMSTTGKTLVTSEAYDNRAGATRAIESMRKAAASATVDDQAAETAAQTKKKAPVAAAKDKATATVKAAVKKPVARKSAERKSAMRTKVVPADAQTL